MQSDQPYLSVMDHNFHEALGSNARPLLLAFTTKWSGSCHLIDPILRRLATEYEDRIRFCKINADSNKKAMRTYGIYELPTILFFKNGQIIDHIKGIVSQNELVAIIEEILESTA